MLQFAMAQRPPNRIVTSLISSSALILPWIWKAPAQEGTKWLAKTHDAFRSKEHQKTRINGMITMRQVPRLKSLREKVKITAPKIEPASDPIPPR